MQVQRQIDELLALRASEWLELLPTASPEQLRDFNAWLSESRLHVQEFLEIAEVEFCLASLDRNRLHDVDAILERIVPRVVTLPPRAGAGPFTTGRNASWRQHRWKLAGIAASFAAAAALLLHLQSGGAVQYSTDIGEQRIVELADASVVTLSADSEISVELQDSNREIELQRGEAIFKVAHDSRRPFRVRTRAGVVQAVGTQFNVHERFNGDTRVSVVEGRVRAVSSKGTELMLSAGDEADIHLDGTVLKRQEPAVASAVAWRDHRLVFKGAPLEEMVTEFNRYNRSVRLRLADLEGDARRYDGAFEATDPQALAEMLSREPDLIVVRQGSEIVIRPKDQR